MNAAFRASSKTHFHWGNEGLRYGFNGMEKSPEEFEGAYSADYREYDSRLGRWLTTDPIVKQWESPYAGFANNPIYFVDPSGLDPEPKSGDPVKAYSKWERMTNKLMGRGYRNDANDYAVANGLKNYQVLQGKNNVTVITDKKLVTTQIEDDGSFGTATEWDETTYSKNTPASTVHYSTANTTDDNYFDYGRSDADDLTSTDGMMRAGYVWKDRYGDLHQGPKSMLTSHPLEIKIGIVAIGLPLGVTGEAAGVGTGTGATALVQTLDGALLGQQVWASFAHRPAKKSSGSMKKGGARASRHEGAITHGGKKKWDNPNQRRKAKERTEQNKKEAED